MEAIAWPRDFPEFKKLDNFLRCGICYDYMKTCMITSCSHNYCSLCIRKYMQYKSACPACFEETYEVNLRNNRPVDDIISIYCTIRDKLFRHLRLSTVHIQSNEIDESKTVENNCHRDNRVSEPNDNLKSPILKRSKNSQSLKKSGKGLQNIRKKLDDDFNLKTPVDKISTEIKSPLSNQAREEMPSTSRISPVKKIPVIFCSPKKTVSTVCSSPVNSLKVPCPVCNVDIPERNINGHLDSCLARDGATKSAPVITKRSPIPKRVYNMMSEKDLRKWLKTYGLNTNGDKKALIHRIQRYTVLYNSECDTDRPRSSAEIIRQVESEEKQEKGNNNAGGIGSIARKINKNSDQKVIEEENKKYLEKNKASFDHLIKTMRERNGTNIKPRKHINVIVDSDDSETEINSYFSKETLNIADGPSCSSSYQAKVENTANSDSLNKATREGEGGIIDMHFLAQSSSPDLSANHDESLIDMIELPESPKTKNANTSKKVMFNDGENSSSDESDKSISLLANCEVVLQETRPLTNSSNKLNDSNKEMLKLTESQMVDPDFLITESQLIEANDDESEDEFTPKRQMKRSKITSNQKTPISVKKSIPRCNEKNMTPKPNQSQTSHPSFELTKAQTEESSDKSNLEMNVQRRTESRSSANELDEASSSDSTSRSSGSQLSFPDVENVDPDSFKGFETPTPKNDSIDRTSVRNKRQRNQSASEFETPKRILRQRTK